MNVGALFLYVASHNVFSIKVHELSPEDMD